MTVGVSSDEAAMLRALELAQQARGHTWPNPMVGCIVVRDGEVLAEGYHHRCGEDHAETDALRKIGFQAEGATLYVNLEPCCHWGRTPPCTDAILRSGARRVVVGMVDPQPLVAGQGIAQLKAAGLEVEVGMHEQACRALNEAHIVHVTQDRPFLTIKTAVTVDGRTATRTGASQWITGEAARAHSRRQRSLHQGILVGVGTVLADDPRLTVRLDPRDIGPFADPTRIVLDSKLRTPDTARMLTEEGPEVWICTTTPAMNSSAADALQSKGAILIPCGDGPQVNLKLALHALAERQVSTVLVEGGAGVHGALIDARLVDRLLVYMAPMMFGGAEALPLALGEGARDPQEALSLTPFAVTRLGADLLLEARPKDGPGAHWWAAQVAS